MTFSNETKGMLIGFIGIAMFSLTLPFTQMAVKEMSPFFVAFSRATIAGFCALILLILGKYKLPTKNQIKRLIIIAIGIVYGFPIFTSMAMTTLPSSHSGIVLGILPLTMSVLAAIRYNDLLKLWQLDKKYPLMTNADKIKWIHLRENPYKIDGLAFFDHEIPAKVQEFLNQYADRKKVFESILLNKLEGFFSDLEWSLDLNPYINSLNSFEI